MFTTVLIALFVVALGYANGANDVSKGVATLVGSGLASYRRALAWGTAWTMAGAVVALVLSAGLLRTFSTGLLATSLTRPELFPLAVAAGAFGWVIFASRTGLPVSTTHAITGAIIGAGIAAGGIGGVRWPLLAASVALPLAFSPIVSAVLGYAVDFVGARPLAGASRYCVCVAEPPLLLAPAPHATTMSISAGALPALAVDRLVNCESSAITARLALPDAAHWTASAVLSFARGLNDNPKIIALGLAAAAGLGLGRAWLVLAGAAAMGAGSYLYGRRVTTTLAERVTRIDPLEGLAASAVASGLVLLASFVALPVSTTHVSMGAIVGARLRRGRQGVRWRTVGGIVAAWVMTLPVAALLGAAAWVVVGR